MRAKSPKQRLTKGIQTVPISDFARGRLVTLRPDDAHRRGQHVLHAVNTIAEGLGLDNLDDADQPADEVTSA